MEALIKGLTFRQENTVRERFKREYSNKPFKFSEYEDLARNYYYNVRGIKKRPDVRVVACFYFPDMKADMVYLPKSLFPPAEEEKYWAVVCFYGVKDDRKIRGYLRIQDLVKERVARKWDAVATTTMDKGKSMINLREIPKGSQIGPLASDIAWDELVAVEAKYLLQKPEDPDPNAAVLLETAEQKLEGGPLVEEDEAEGDRRSEVSSNHGALVAYGSGVGGGQLLPYAPSAGTLVNDLSEINPYPTPKEDAESRRAGKNRQDWGVGDRLDIKDDGVWYAGTIKAINEHENHILVGFDGYHIQFDTWVPRDSLRLAPLHKFSETSAEREERLRFLESRRGGGGSQSDLHLSSFKDLVKKNRAMESLNQQLEEALMRAKAHIDEIRRQFYIKTGQMPELSKHPMHQKMASAARASEDGDEKLFDTMQLVMIIDALKAEVGRLQDANEKLVANEQLSVSLMRDTLRNARKRREQRAEILLSEDEVKQRRASTKGGGKASGAKGSGKDSAEDDLLSDEKAANLMPVVKLMQDEFKKMIVESEYREDQLREYQELNRRMQSDANALTAKLQRFRQKKDAARDQLAAMANASGSQLRLTGPTDIDELEVKDSELMARIAELQDAEQREMLLMQGQIDAYEKKASNNAKKATQLVDDEENAVSDSDYSDLDEKDEEEEAEAKAKAAGGKKKAGEYDVLDPKNPGAFLQRSVSIALAPETQAKMNELQRQVASLQEQLAQATEQRKVLEAQLRGRRKSAYLYSSEHDPADDKKEDDDMTAAPTAKDLKAFLQTNELGYDAFQRYLAEQKVEPWILFYRAVTDYITLFDATHPDFNTNKLIQLPTAQHIANNFVRPNARKLVPLSPPVQRRILDEIATNHVTSSTFNAALEEIVELMVNEHFSKFMRTPIYRRLRKRTTLISAAPSPYTGEIEGFVAGLDAYRKQVEGATVEEFLRSRGAGNPQSLEEWFFKLTEERRSLMKQLVGLREEALEQRARELEERSAVRRIETNYQKYRERKSIDGAGGSMSDERAVAVLKAARSAINFNATAKNSIGSVRRCLDEIKDEFAATAQDFQILFSKFGLAMGNVCGLMVAAQENYKKEAAKRMKLFDALQNLRGNIRVFCRVRPLLPQEMARGDLNCIEYVGATQLMVMKGKAEDDMNPLSSQRQDGKAFTFDRVFGPSVDQGRVFADVKNLIGSVLDGYNVCIFAYGQTGSGKTYTMDGPPENLGINHRAVRALFEGIASLQPQYRFQVHVSMLEIYNEQISDLLNDEFTPYSDEVLEDGPRVSKTNRQGGLEANSADDDEPVGNNGKLQIRRNVRGMYVTNTTHVQVENPDDVAAVVATGMKNRTTRATNANEHSSRSHAILLVTVDGIDQVTLNRTYGKLYLVDLAGSERLKNSESQGQRLKEANYINKSLSALGDVMKALSERKDAKDKIYVPYRNSKLTYLLQDALGGNSKTMMFVCVSPADSYAQETLFSLEFARRVRKVQLDPHAATQNAALQKYKIKLEEMKEQARLTTEKLKSSLKKVQASVRERDQIIQELTEKLKSIRRNAAETKRKQYLGSQPLDSWSVSKSRLNEGEDADDADIPKPSALPEDVMEDVDAQSQGAPVQSKHEDEFKEEVMSESGDKAPPAASSSKPAVAAARPAAAAKPAAPAPARTATPGAAAKKPGTPAAAASRPATGSSAAAGAKALPRSGSSTSVKSAGKPGTPSAGAKPAPAAASAAARKK